MHIQRHVLVFPKVKPEGCLDLSVLQYDPLYLCAFFWCMCVCRSACVFVCDSRYLPSTLIKPFRNPPTTASTHKHRLETALQAVTLPLTRCSWLRCQIKHLQIAGVPVHRGRQQHSCSCSVTAEREVLAEDLSGVGSDVYDKTVCGRWCCPPLPVSIYFRWITLGFTLHYKHLGCMNDSKCHLFWNLSV